MYKPKVSIIMGVYNCENSISECIDSILNQTFTNWECIICDDCSTDETFQVLRRYAELDCRLKIIQNNENSKLAYSLNHCLKYCQGEYVARIDADDKCVPERLERQVKFLEEHVEYAVVGTGAYIFDGETIVGVRQTKELPSKRDVLFGPTFMHPTIMMRKKVYDVLGGYTVSKRTVRGQDWDLWFKFYAAKYQGYNIQEPLIIYHESPADLKKRTFKTARMYTMIALKGYKLLQVPFYKYILAFKPLIVMLIPRTIRSRLQ